MVGSLLGLTNQNNDFLAKCLVVNNEKYCPKYYITKLEEILHSSILLYQNKP
jgi:hypothetical protein